MNITLKKYIMESGWNMLGVIMQPGLRKEILCELNFSRNKTIYNICNIIIKISTY